MPKFVMVLGKSPEQCKIKTVHTLYPNKLVKTVREKGYKVYYFRKCKTESGA